MDSNQFAQNIQSAPEPRKKGIGKVIFLIIGLAAGVVLTALIMCAVKSLKSEKAPETIEGAGYETAEEAVEAYVNFLKEENYEGILSTFAVESYLDNYDMTEYFEYVQTFTALAPSGGLMTAGFYSDSDFARDLIIESRRAYILSGVQRQLIQVMAQNSDEEIAEDIAKGNTLKQGDDIDPDEIMDFLATDLELDTIEIGHFRDDRYYDVPAESIKTYLKHYEKFWGSEIEPVTLEIEIDNADYTLFMLCVCYDDRWYIADFNNPITLAKGISPAGKGLVPEDQLKK